MNRNLLIAAGVFLAIVVAGLFLIRKPSSPTSTQGMPVPETTTGEKIVSETEETTSTREITVTGNEYSFNPASITVKKGETIKLTFINAGSTLHDLLIDELKVKTKMVAPGKSDTVEFTVDSDSNLTFYCGVSNHQELGMEGTLEIQ